jgi:hypothetical protein
MGGSREPDWGQAPREKRGEKGTVGLLKNPIPGKMALDNKGISIAIFAQMALFQQPHSPYYCWNGARAPLALKFIL